MTRVVYRFYRLGSTLRYRLSRRVTPAGWLVAAGLVVTGLVGVDLEQSVASQTFAVLLCLSAVAMLSAWLFQGRFAVQRRLPRFASVGEPFAYRVTVRDQKGRPWHELELMEDLADPRPTREQFAELMKAGPRSRSFRLAERDGSRDHRQVVLKPASLPSLAAGGEAEVRLEAMPLKRGPLRFLGSTLAQRDPLGLFRGFIPVSLPQTMLILPKRYPLPGLALPGRHKYQPGGVAFATAVGESEEFVSVRDYRPGDPLRHVHWRSSARTGRLVVKEFEDEFFMRHALVLDTFGGVHQADVFEEAVSVAASFSCTVDTQESLLDLMFVGAQAVCFTTGRGVAHAEQALEILSSVQLCRNRSFSSLQALVLQHVSRLSGCICILLAWDDARRELVRKLRAFGLPLVVLVVTDEAGAREWKNRTPDEDASRVHLLVAGRIEAGLEALGKAGA